MEGLMQLDAVGDISPALEATEDFAAPGGLTPPKNQTCGQPKKLQEASGAALAKLSSSGVWSLLAGQQPEVGPLGLAWADGLSVVGLRPGKRSRARSTNDLVAHGKEGAAPAANDTATAASNAAFKKGHNRSRSDFNYRTADYTDNGLPSVDTLKNTILNHQMEAEKGSSSSSIVVKQAEMEYREGPRGRWSECHVELTPCELRLYTLDSSANRQLGNAYSLSHCQGVVAPAPCQPADPRTLQAVFFNSTRVQLRAATQWEAAEWRRLVWEKVQVVRPVRQRKAVTAEKAVTFPDAPDGTPPLSRPTTLPLFSQRCQDVLKAGLLQQLLDQNNWCAFTFVLSRTALQAFPTEGRGPVSRPLRQYPLASCSGVRPDPEVPDQRERFQAAFAADTLRLRADTADKALEWTEALRGAVGARQPAREEGGSPVPQGVLLRSKERRQREHRAKRQSVTTSFLGLLTCVAQEKGLTAQGFTCAGCQRPVGASRGKAKVCHYSGWYYCQNCHQDNTFLIPARLLHNWDTSKHKVSKQAKEFLEFVYEEPLLDVQQLNGGGLYEHCEPLSAVLRLRQQLQSLRAYLFSCRATIAEDLRRRIFPREYLLQHIHLYSIADLQQVIDGHLAPFLSKVIKFASAHVLGCTLCRQKGFICELCHSGHLIYPFQDSATRRCSGCDAVFHAECRQKCQPCPRCVRRELHHTKRPSSFWSPDGDDHHLPYQDT